MDSPSPQSVFIRDRICVLALILLMLAMVTPACVQLKEIRAFAELSGEVGDQFPGLTRDLYESCMSQQRYIVAQKEEFRVDKFVDLNDDGNPLMAEGLQVCRQYKDQQDRLIKANGTLVSYMKSMADLAADDLTNFDKGIEGFGTAIVSANLLTAEESTAVNNLAKFLIRMATEGYRRKKLRDVIKETNPHIRIITSGLGRIVAQNYVQQLENERLAMKDYYRKLAKANINFSTLLVRSAGGGVDISDPVPLDDIRAKYEARNAAMNVKVRGAKAYADILKAVAEGHQKLNDNADKLNSREVLTETLSYAKTIQALATDFRKAF